MLVTLSRRSQSSIPAGVRSPVNDVPDEEDPIPVFGGKRYCFEDAFESSSLPMNISDH